MARQYFDDGSYLDYDGGGNVTGGADIFGGSIAAPSGAVANQFMSLLSYTVKSVVDSTVAAKNARTNIQLAQAGALPGGSLALPAGMGGLLLLGLGAFFLFKLVK